MTTYIETSEHKISLFRIWITRMWAEHCNEILTYNGAPANYGMEDWIKKNKWFLKQQFQSQLKNNRNR